VNSDHLPLATWLNRYLPDLTVVSTTTRSIDGHDALIVEAGGIGEYYTKIFVALDTDVFEIVYPEGTPALLPIYEEIVNSLQLTASTVQ
jgi:hypothetical protein